MDRKLGGLILVVLAVSPSASAQEVYRRAGATLGEAIFGRSQERYDREYERRIQLESALQGAILARQQADAAELHRKAVHTLHSIWAQLGLPDDEARSVASSFEWDAQMDAIRQRAARDGYKATMDAGIRAYREYQYPLANQLVLAAYLLPAEANP